MAAVPEAKKYVPVYSTFGQLAGEMIRILLESHGIPAIIIQESAGAAYGLTIGRLGEATILVPAARVEDAEAILQAMDEGYLEAGLPPDKSEAEQKYMNNKLPPSENIKNLA